jgi:hypothetical protein
VGTVLAIAAAACVGDAPPEQGAVLLAGPVFADCDGDPRNGAETDLASTRDDCGACGVSCAAYEGTSVRESECAQGVCTIAACIYRDDGSVNVDCDGKIGNGCEVVSWPRAQQSTPSWLGAIDGDVDHPAGRQLVGWGEAWFTFQLAERDSSWHGRNLHAALALEAMQAGDYDLEILQGPSPVPFGQWTSEARLASWTTVRKSGALDIADGWGDDSTLVTLHVKPTGAFACRGWDLFVYGNL